MNIFTLAFIGMGLSFFTATTTRATPGDLECVEGENSFQYIEAGRTPPELVNFKTRLGLWITPNFQRHVLEIIPLADLLLEQAQVQTLPGTEAHLYFRAHVRATRFQEGRFVDGNWTIFPITPKIIHDSAFSCIESLI